jgi:glycine/D-amino acid oxidase-like deaminating enzyme
LSKVSARDIAAGAWSGEVAAMFGMKLPVTPMRRFEHYFTAGSPIERLPYVKDVARYRTIDLGRFGYERVERGRLIGRRGFCEYGVSCRAR